MSDPVTMAVVCAAGFALGCYLLALGMESLGAERARIKASQVQRILEHEARQKETEREAFPEEAA